MKLLQVSKVVKVFAFFKVLNLGADAMNPVFLHIPTSFTSFGIYINAILLYLFTGEIVEILTGE